MLAPQSLPHLRHKGSYLAPAGEKPSFMLYFSDEAHTGKETHAPGKETAVSTVTETANEMVVVCLWICAVFTALQFIAMGFCAGVLVRLRPLRGTCPVCGGALTGNYKSRTAKFVYLDCPHCHSRLQGSIQGLLKNLKKQERIALITELLAVVTGGVSLGTAVLVCCVWDGGCHTLLDRHILKLPFAVLFTCVAVAIFGKKAWDRWQRAWLYHTVILTRADENIAGLQD